MALFFFLTLLLTASFRGDHSLDYDEECVGKNKGLVLLMLKI